MQQLLPERTPLPWYWEAAPMPEAESWLLGGEGLRRLQDGAAIPASDALLAALCLSCDDAASAPKCLLALDAAGCTWRLRLGARMGGHALWLAQRRERSRELLFEKLRCALAGALAGAVRHELSGPLQTVAFNAEIAARVMGSGADDGQLRSNIELIRRCVRELRERQSDAVELWLAAEAAPAEPIELCPTLQSTAALLRGRLAAVGVQLVLELAGLEAVLPRGRLQAARVGLLALLLMAGERLAQTRQGTAPAQLKVGLVEDQAITIRAGAEAAVLGPEFAVLGDEAALAVVAVVLEAGGLELAPPCLDEMLRLNCGKPFSRAA